MTHEEYIREPEGATTAILMVHGILGTPRHFDMLLDLVPDDFAIYAILLPGHGGITKDFSHTSLEEWESKVGSMLNSLREKYEKIYLAGHSLGTLLLLDELFRSDERIAGVFLMAVPLTPWVAPATVRHAIPTALGFKARENDGLSHAWRAAYSVQPNKNLFRYLTYAPRFIDLFRKIIRVRRGLLEYRGGDYPVLAVQSYYDELVTRGSGRYLKRCEAIRTETLRHSRHFYYPEGDLDLLRGYFTEVIGDKKTNE